MAMNPSALMLRDYSSGSKQSNHLHSIEQDYRDLSVLLPS